MLEGYHIVADLAKIHEHNSFYTETSSHLIRSSKQYSHCNRLSTDFNIYDHQKFQIFTKPA